jgi:tetratricopeptide (TPR) repeat protein
MLQPNRPSPFVRFAHFEVHFRAGELRKEGRRIRLQEQPFQVLTKRYEKVLESDPEFQVARSFLIHSLEQAGRFDEAVAQTKIVAAQAGHGSDAAAALGRAYRLARATGYWKEVLRQVQRGKDPGAGSDLDIAAIYIQLGNKDRAFDLLERAYADRNMWLMNLKVDPRFENLRSDDRYESLLSRIGLRANLRSSS